MKVVGKKTATLMGFINLKGLKMIGLKWNVIEFEKKFDTILSIFS